ncbi:hypothetical protein PV08_00410 [Exophiala spinifera]|uniref:Ribosomal protein S21 n=1 Tax=Exophiala spinifera TaxID=91928 RepID=A0A0D2BMM8_9EURO|nr:uncharacterized protein PV08_00410 [Exophiala spinifera]KIW19835.1 hypothetical protein PV08_00410 [Exophiala spinifera]
MEPLPSLRRCFALSRPRQQTLFSPSTCVRRVPQQQLPHSSRAKRSFTTSLTRLRDGQQRQSSPPSQPDASNVSKTWKQMMESMKPMQPTSRDGSGTSGGGGSSSSSTNMSAFRGQKSQSRLLAGLNESIARHALDQDAMARELAMAGTSSIALRLKPSLGRTVDGVYGEPARAFRALERKCTENKVKSDSLAQKRHVRRGQRKKDMRMLRWRRLFREGFIAECGKIRRMRKQGW